MCVVGVNDGGGGCYVGAGVHGGEPLHTARGGVVFRGDIKSRCELEPVGVVEILGNTSSETVHVLLRMGVGDAAIPSQGGSHYNSRIPTTSKMVVTKNSPQEFPSISPENMTLVRGYLTVLLPTPKPRLRFYGVINRYFRGMFGGLELEIDGG